MSAPKPETVEEYIADFPDEVQLLLQQMRQTIKNAAPEAEESIGYNMPMYKWNGMLVSFSGWKAHIGLYPTPAADGELKKKLVPFEGAKATLRFPINKPLPLDIIEEVVKLRLKENEQKAKS